MTTRIDSSDGPSTQVTSSSTAARVTAPPARPFKQVLGAGTAAVINGAEAAVTRLPGGPVLAAAFRQPGSSSMLGGGTLGSTFGSGGGTLRPEGATGTVVPTTGVGVGGGTLGAAVGAQVAGGGTAVSGTGGIEQTLADNGDRTLYYLDLQQRIAAETQTYTALSNVMKARHDTIKNAIGNIR